MNAFNSGSVGKTVETLVKEAGHKLEIALENLEKQDGHPIGAEETTTTTTTLVSNSIMNGSGGGDPEPAHTDASDPDDLAAAFFANQARQRNSEHKLRVDEWATTIVAHRESSSSSSSSLRRGSFETASSPPPTKEIPPAAPIDEAYVEGLYAAFQDGLATTTMTTTIASS
jgi:hypothetical protein